MTVADSGWYWCDTDSYQNVVHVNIVPDHNMMIPPVAPIEWHNFEDNINDRSNDEREMIILTHDERQRTNDRYGERQSINERQDEKIGTADQLRVYDTYQGAWQDNQVIINQTQKT